MLLVSISNQKKTTPIVANMAKVVTTVVVFVELVGVGEVGSWGGGSVDDDPAEEDDDFEVELEAVDDVSFALAVVSSGSKALVSDSILAAMAPVRRGR